MGAMMKNHNGVRPHNASTRSGHRPDETTWWRYSYLREGAGAYRRIASPEAAQEFACRRRKPAAELKEELSVPPSAPLLLPSSLAGLHRRAPPPVG